MRAEYRLVSRTDGRTVVAQLHIADGFWSRFVGLQFRRPLPSECGLLLVPCHAVHTCFVRFALDLIFLDREGRILAMRRNLRPCGPREGRREPTRHWKHAAARCKPSRGSDWQFGRLTAIGHCQSR